MRRCGLTGNTVGLNIDEDQFNDNERSHTSETVGMVSFSDSFHADFDGLIDAGKTAALSLGDYALPGSEVRYTINAQSLGNKAVDIDSVVITDTIPNDVRLKVTDIGSAGTGPVDFSDGSPNSNLIMGRHLIMYQRPTAREGIKALRISVLIRKAHLSLNPERPAQGYSNLLLVLTLSSIRHSAKRHYHLSRN